MNPVTKHLFSVSLNENKKNEYFDDTPFTAGRISPTTREAKETTSKAFTKAMMKSLHLPALLIGYLLIGLGAAVLLAFLKALPDTDFMTALTNGIWLLIGGGVSVAIGACLLIYCKRSSKKQEESEDLPEGMDESLNSMEAISRRIQMELNLPDDDQVTEVEILPYRYKATSDGDTKEVLNNGCFENTSVFFWTEGDDVCVTDYECVMRFPKTAVVGYRTEDVKYKISYWFKDEDHDKDEYAQYNIKEDSESNYRLRVYYTVLLRSGEDTYEIRVPCYDFEIFQGIVGAACLDGSEEG
jgi:hypothetical protein